MQGCNDERKTKNFLGRKGGKIISRGKSNNLRFIECFKIKDFL